MTKPKSVETVCQELIDKSIDKSIIWTQVGNLKRYLKDRNGSMRNVAYLNTYLDFLQKFQFIFDCEETYITVYEQCIYILAKDKRFLNYRMDYSKIDNSSKSPWEEVSASFLTLLRLRNAAYVSAISNPNVEETSFGSIIKKDISN